MTRVLVQPKGALLEKNDSKAAEHRGEAHTTHSQGFLRALRTAGVQMHTQRMAHGVLQAQSRLMVGDATFLSAMARLGAFRNRLVRYWDTGAIARGAVAMEVDFHASGHPRDSTPLLLRAAACSAVIKSCAFAPSTRPAGGLLDGGLHPPGGVGAAGARVVCMY